MNQIRIILICVLLVWAVSPAAAQEGKKRKKKKDDVTEVKPAEPEKKKDEKPFKEIGEVTKACKKYDGLFTIYQDTTNGKTYMEITEDQIGKEFIYFKHVMEGVLDARYFRGAYRDQKIFQIGRYFDKIEFREKSTSFYYNPDNAISMAANVNVNEPIVLSEKIVGRSNGEDSITRYLIESDAVYLTETINQVKPSASPGSSAKTFNLGKLSKDKTQYSSIHNYPENTDVVVEYAFENPYPSVYGSEAITNSRYVTVQVRHSLIAMPDNDYRPRYDDDRVGYFLLKTTDLTSPSATPYRDVIQRWDLRKKDPTAAISEPVEPIVWWIENTTPVEIRGIIKNAALRWNEAFEVAGFKNALVVKDQPDDAEWDAGDIRYNVLRWTSSPNPPFGGYGPRLANPRTGQILGADVMLEYIYLTNRMRQHKVFGLEGILLDEEVAAEELEWEGDQSYCSAALHGHYENLFANYAAKAIGLDEAAKTELIEQTISRLILHELGHTLGLSHNFCASYAVSMEELNDRELIEKIGLSASVMDYHATNLALDKSKQGYYSIHRPGIYDKWAIQYGYSEYENEEAEQKGLAAILARSNEPALCFGNDADDMRSAGKGLDPRINVSDLSSDPISFSIDRMELAKKTIPTLKASILEDGGSYHELRNGYNIMTGYYGGALNIISRFVGGIYIDRSRVGNDTDAKPFTPVPYTEQKRAMNTLVKYAFAPNAFDFNRDILNYLKVQRRGWDLGGAGDDPKEHIRVLTMQRQVLSHLMHPKVLTRLTDSELYGNRYSVTEMLGDVTAGIFEADLYVSVNTFRQQLQLDYVNRLGSILDGSSNNYLTRTAALYQLDKIKKMETKAKSPDENTRAHRQHVLFAVDKILEKDR